MKENTFSILCSLFYLPSPIPHIPFRIPTLLFLIYHSSCFVFIFLPSIPSFLYNPMLSRHLATPQLPQPPLPSTLLSYAYTIFGHCFSASIAIVLRRFSSFSHLLSLLNSLHPNFPSRQPAFHLLFCILAPYSYILFLFFVFTLSQPIPIFQVHDTSTLPPILSLCFLHSTILLSISFLFFPPPSINSLPYTINQSFSSNSVSATVFPYFHKP